MGEVAVVSVGSPRGNCSSGLSSTTQRALFVEMLAGFKDYGPQVLHTPLINIKNIATEISRGFTIRSDLVISAPDLGINDSLAQMPRDVSKRVPATSCNTGRLNCDGVAGCPTIEY